VDTPSDTGKVGPGWMIVLQQAKKPGPDDVHRLKLALIGFRLAKSRHEADRTARDVSRAYISMFEATIWTSALDQQLCTFYGGSYKRARDQDECGVVVNAVRWARDRHAHQLPVTLNEDPTPFLGGNFFPLKLSLGVRWREFSELPPAEERYRNPAGELAYRKHLEGHNSGKTLEKCDRWFANLEAIPTCLL
jgi:hypothetical protein